MKLKAWHGELGWIWTELKEQPMYEEGAFQHMLLVARDVSSLHKYEEMFLQQAYFALMIMDIDNFKHINDYYGHEVGDVVLIEYGRRVSAILGEYGVVGRYGGDEFMVVLPYEMKSQVEEVAHRIISEIQKPIEIQQTILSVTTRNVISFTFSRY